MGPSIYTNMIGRTVYLPPTLDTRLRQIAFEQKVSKNDLIRMRLEKAVQNKDSAFADRVHPWSVERVPRPPVNVARE